MDKDRRKLRIRIGKRPTGGPSGPTEVKIIYDRLTGEYRLKNEDIAAQLAFDPRQQRRREVARAALRSASIGVLKLGDLLGLLIPRKTRELLYTPSHHDIVQDFLEMRVDAGPWRYLWLAICLSVQVLTNFTMTLFQGPLRTFMDIFRSDT